MRKVVVAIAVVALMSGCARRPDAITPLTMPVNAYSGLTCEQLTDEHRRSTVALEAVSKQQNEAATGDAVGVFLIGVPVSSLSGSDREGQVALHKGEIVAIEAQQRNKGC